MSEPVSSLLVSRDGPIVRLLFNRPAQMNALDRATAQAFAHACRELAADASVRAVIIGGTGRAFMAGGDLDELRADRPARRSA